MTKNKSPTLLGLGNDIIEIERIRQSIESHGNRLLDRLFTKTEQEYCFKHKDPIPHFAGRFSAKEAIVKAFGTGFGQHATWLDIEIENNAEGKPVVAFSDAINKKFNHPRMSVSISHCELYATAVAIWEC